MVPERGLEPPRPKTQGLNLLAIPVRLPGHLKVTFVRYLWCLYYQSAALQHLPYRLHRDRQLTDH